MGTAAKAGRAATLARDARGKKSQDAAAFNKESVCGRVCPLLASNPSLVSSQQFGVRELVSNHRRRDQKYIRNATGRIEWKRLFSEPHTVAIREQGLLRTNDKSTISYEDAPEASFSLPAAESG